MLDMMWLYIVIGIITLVAIGAIVGLIVLGMRTCPSASSAVASSATSEAASSAAPTQVTTVLYGVNIPGGDFSNMPLAGSFLPNQCNEFCLEDPNCVGFAANTAGDCFLKQTVTSGLAAADTISGLVTSAPA